MPNFSFMEFYGKIDKRSGIMDLLSIIVGTIVLLALLGALTFIYCAIKIDRGE